jgi:hypothetical protein
MFPDDLILRPILLNITSNIMQLAIKGSAFYACGNAAGYIVTAFLIYRRILQRPGTKLSTALLAAISLLEQEDLH